MEDKEFEKEFQKMLCNISSSICEKTESSFRAYNEAFEYIKKIYIGAGAKKELAEKEAMKTALYKVYTLGYNDGMEDAKNGRN